MVLSESAVSAFTTLIVILDPIGLIPVFLSLTSGMTPMQRRQTAAWAALLTCLVLIFFALFGGALLAYLGVSLHAFRIAGGLLLFYTAFEMAYGSRQERQQSTAERAMEEYEPKTVAAFPLAIPLMAGPGAITACILIADQERAGIGAPVWLLAIIAAACTVSLVCFLSAAPIDRLIGHTGKIVLTRLLGVLLAALAVQFVADGVLAMAGTASA